MKSIIEIELVVWKKIVEKGPFLSLTPGSNKESKTPSQIELNINFTYTNMFMNYFFREQLPSLIYMELYVLSVSTFYFLQTFSCHA